MVKVIKLASPSVCLSRDITPHIRQDMHESRYQFRTCRYTLLLTTAAQHCRLYKPPHVCIRVPCMPGLTSTNRKSQNITSHVGRSFGMTSATEDWTRDLELGVLGSQYRPESQDTGASTALMFHTGRPRVATHQQQKRNKRHQLATRHVT